MDTHGFSQRHIDDLGNNQMLAGRMGAWLIIGWSLFGVPVGGRGAFMLPWATKTRRRSTRRRSGRSGEGAGCGGYYFFVGYVVQVLVDVPDVAEGVGQLAMAGAPEGVLHWLPDLGAGG